MVSKVDLCVDHRKGREYTKGNEIVATRESRVVPVGDSFLISSGLEGSDSPSFLPNIILFGSRIENPFTEGKGSTMVTTCDEDPSKGIPMRLGVKNKIRRR